MDKARDLVREELSRLYPQLQTYRKALSGKRAAIYVGGSFKAFSLVQMLPPSGHGCGPGRVPDRHPARNTRNWPPSPIPEPSSSTTPNPLELSAFMKEKDVDILVGGVKERPIAYKLGIGFCDHNHERKIPLEGFVGMANFAKEVHDHGHEPPSGASRPGGHGENHECAASNGEENCHAAA